MTVDLVITTYKPTKTFFDLVDKISTQTVEIRKIIILNVEQKFFDRLLYATKFIEEHKNVEVRHISAREFDCGKSRNLAVKLSDADYVLMMGQNVVPNSPDVLEKLLKAINSDEEIALSYACQVLCDEAPEMFKFVKRFYFSQDSYVRSIKDFDNYGWTTFMCSNLCALYRRDIFDKLGGFSNHVICNEDVLYAAKALKEGYKVAYVSDAVVTDYKVLTEDDVQRLSFDKAVSFAKHPELFDISAIRDESKKLDKMTVAHLKRSGFKIDLFMHKKYARALKKGFSKGVKYKKISMYDMKKYSANPEYWRIDEILRDRNSVDVHAGYGKSEAEREMLSKPPVKALKKDEDK